MAIELKTIQIIPATGWWMRFRSCMCDEGIIEWPLICWALREDGEVFGICTSPDGMTDDVDNLDDGFIRYVYRGPEVTAPKGYLEVDEDISNCSATNDTDSINNLHEKGD